jgi:hypothetical protein
MPASMAVPQVNDPITTDDSAKPFSVRMINARVISRSVTALIDRAPNAGRANTL